MPASAAQVNYAYDGQGRLIEATYDNGTDIIYSYDSAGNRTSQVLFVPPSGSTVAAADAAGGNVNCTGLANDPAANSSTGIACFKGVITEYSINPNANGGVTVSDSVQGRDGLQNITNAVMLVFANNSNFATTTNLYVLDPDQALVARLYREMFTVPATQPIPGGGGVENAAGKTTPDVAGLLLWSKAFKTLPAYVRASPASAALTKTTFNNLSLVDDLVPAPLYQNNYANIPSADFVTALYWNALNRGPSAADLAYWTGAIDNSGMSRDTVLALIATSAEAVNACQWPAGSGSPNNVPGWILLESQVGS